jgi:hypothetical protein
MIVLDFVFYVEAKRLAVNKRRLGLFRVREIVWYQYITSENQRSAVKKEKVRYFADRGSLSFSLSFFSMDIWPIVVVLNSTPTGSNTYPGISTHTRTYR